MGPFISQILATSSRVRLDSKADSGNSVWRLKKGQIIEARVDRVVSQGHTRLIIQGKSVSARTHLPLQSGQKILLRVTRVGAQPEFQVAETKGGEWFKLPPDALKIMGKPDPYRILSRLLKSVSDTNRATFDSAGAEAFKRLAHLLKSMQDPSCHPDRDTVKSFIHKSGLTWENKLLSMLLSEKSLSKEAVQRLIAGDLKALSMSIIQNSSDEEGGGVTDIRAYLESLERLQVLNSQVSKESGRYFIPLPTPFDDSIRFGQMLIDLGKESGADTEKKNRVVRVSLLLEMSNLGHLQVDLSILENSITGMLTVGNDTLHTLIKAHIPELSEKLQKSGFHVYEISCCTVDPQTLSTASLTDRLMDDRNGLVSIII
jgi:flagellar hook-length control protein FliK